ncbi:MAG: hypothetical protein ABIJ17_00045 [Patescibacteria group bacterium]
MSFEKFPKIESKENKEDFEEVQEVNFDDLSEGDKLVICTADKIDEGFESVYIVDVDKIRKTKNGEIKHLDVTIKEIERKIKKAIKEKGEHQTRASENNEEIKYLKALNLPEKIYEDEYKISDELVAKMPGGVRTLEEKYRIDYLNNEFDKIPKEELDSIGETKGIIKTGENNHLYFKDINYKNEFEETKSGKRRKPKAGALRSSNPIRKILLFKKEITERPVKQEEGLESIPTSEDVQLVFEKLLEGKEYETIRKLEDEQGLYLWDIKIFEEDGHTEYLYMRKGRYVEGGQASNTAIHIAFFDEEDFPVGGSSVAKYIGGEWKLTPYEIK